MGLPSGVPPAPPLPGWLGSAVAVTTQVGVPTVFAAVLLYFVLFRVTATLEGIEKNEDRRTQLLEQTQDAFTDALDRQTAAFQAAIRENIEANKALAVQLGRPGGQK